MEVKIQIPDNCELIKGGDTYVVHEKDSKPKSWEEFCEKYPVYIEAYIDQYSMIYDVSKIKRDPIYDKNICVSKEEAEAFLALMQLRQLRKVWVGDWEPKHQIENITINKDLRSDNIYAGYNTLSSPLSFPCLEMAREFLNCFKDLLEKAKVLL